MLLDIVRCYYVVCVIRCYYVSWYLITYYKLLL